MLGTRSKKRHDMERSHQAAFGAAEARLNELKAEAKAEGCDLSQDSEQDLRAFLSRHRFTHRPLLTLLDNGNLRALWINAEGEQIGLQFRGCSEVQYVLFAKRGGVGFMARAAGRDTLADIDRQIAAHDLGRLMVI